VTRKIYIRLKGGLGNQIFQYAFALTLKNSGINVDGFWIAQSLDNFGRSYLLDTVLNSAPNIVIELPQETIHVKSENLEAIVSFLQSHREASVLLDGYFQDIRYLQSSDLENHFKLPEFLMPTTAVHIRRSEYGHHGILPFSYYTDALISLGSPDFVVYGDEPNFAAYMFSKIRGYRGTVQPSVSDPAKDFLQMTTHSGIVMANSTFSWLAAFLAFKSRHARIVYPSQWTLMDIVPGHDLSWQKVQTTLIQP